MIYTGTGDDGTTSLVGGRRVSKTDIRVEAYGTVDELNSHLGVVAELVRNQDAAEYEVLKTMQQHLFVIQTLLATEDEALAQQLPQLNEDAPHWLEQQIDRIQEHLPQLHSFVIPGGSLAGAQCHVARCVCRRAERRVVALMQQEKVDAKVAKYLNRLSDYCFVLSRKITLTEGKETYFSAH